MTTRTPQETQALRQHLAKPRPYNGACGCLGPQPIDRTTDQRHIELLTVNPDAKAIDVARCFASTFDIPSVTVLKMVRDHQNIPFEFVSTYHCEVFASKLQQVGISFVRTSRRVPLEPACPCAMLWYEKVDGMYYKIDEIRSEDGISHSVKLVGPIGGPYN